MLGLPQGSASFNRRRLIQPQTPPQTRQLLPVVKLQFVNLKNLPPPLYIAPRKCQKVRCVAMAKGLLASSAALAVA